MKRSKYKYIERFKERSPTKQDIFGAIRKKDKIVRSFKVLAFNTSESISNLELMLSSKEFRFIKKYPILGKHPTYFLTKYGIIIDFHIIADELALRKKMYSDSHYFYLGYESEKNLSLQDVAFIYQEILLFIKEIKKINEVCDKLICRKCNKNLTHSRFLFKNHICLDCVHTTYLNKIMSFRTIRNEIRNYVKSGIQVIDKRGK